MHVRMGVLIVAALAAAWGATAQENVSVSGKWELYASIAGYESRQSCEFSQTGTEMTGRCTSERGEVEISGKVSGKEVSFSYKTDYQGTPITVAFKGVMEAERKFTGKVEVPEYSVEGEFTATAGE